MNYISQAGNSFNCRVNSCNDSIHSTIAQGKMELNAIDTAVRNAMTRCKDAIANGIESSIDKMQEMKSNVKAEAQRCVREVENGINAGAEKAKIGMDATAKKICNFLYDYSFTFAVAGASCATLYFAPELFIAGFIVSFIARVEFKNLVDKYIKDEFNPYADNAEFGPQYLSTTDAVVSTAAALDAIVLGTIYCTPYVAISLLPILGGVVAGNAMAKIAMDVFQRQTENSVEVPINQEELVLV
ncbi:MAG: hypothetical protein H0V82_01155 [Candidatus Protochlamydia sp.]|nr:hypothetical protein [Candidatus Protochlamydia sp.]